MKEKRFLFNLNRYLCDEPYLFRDCAGHTIRRCVSKVKVYVILEACHTSSVGGHHSGVRTTSKVLQSGSPFPIDAKL